MSDKDQQTEDKDPFDLSPESPFSSEAMASVTDERFTNSKKFGQDMNGLTLNDEDLIRQVMKEQKQRKKHRRKTEKAAKQKRKDNRGRARKMKERKVKVAKEELEEAKQQQTTHVKRRLTALERETMKRYGLYHNIHEFMHKDENNARPIAKLLDQLVDRIQRRQSTASRVESFKMFLPRVNNRGKITRDSLREGIKAVGLKFMDEEADSVFDQVDKNGDGNLDYNEFVQALMGDKPQMLRNVSQDVVDKLRGAQKRQLQMLRHMGQDGAGNRWAIGKAKRILIDKIKQKVQGGAGASRRAFRYFQDSLDKSGVNINSFGHGCRAVGMVVPQDMQWALYNSFDANGDGVISFKEFKDVLEEDEKISREAAESAGTIQSALSLKSGVGGGESLKTGRSTKSTKSIVTLKRLETLGLLRPRTAEHHKKRVTRNLPSVNRSAGKSNKPVKRGMRRGKPAFMVPLNRTWNIHAKTKGSAIVKSSQPYSDWDVGEVIVYKSTIHHYNH